MGSFDPEGVGMDEDQMNVGRPGLTNELLARATVVMGSENAAVSWMNRPAIGLSNQKPVDLLSTSAGIEAVKEYLTRLEYGVHL